MTESCRWGILGAADIARKNWQAIHLASNARLTALACRDAGRGAAFLDECSQACPLPERPELFEDYHQLLASDNVDAVYVPLPTGLRKEWVVRAAEAGKHVLCEKPCAINAADLAEMIDACQANNVQFMDGVMFMHSARLTAMREQIDAGAIGDIKRINTQFSFRGPEEFLAGNIRVNSDLEPQGCLGDLGWYTIRFILWTLQYAMPERVTGRILSAHGSAASPESVPMEFSGELIFANGISATFYNAFVTEHTQLALIAGTEGHLVLNDFVLPWFGNQLEFTTHRPRFAASGCDFNMERHSRHHAVAEYSNSDRNAQETRLFETFSACVLSGSPDDHWPEIALKTQRIMDACLESARHGGSAVTL